MSPDQNTASQIEHIIINANKKGVREDVKSMRGQNIDSDQFLVKAVIKKKLSVIYKEKTETSTEMEQNKLTKPIKT
jgi:hypothetical protein